MSCNGQRSSKKTSQGGSSSSNMQQILPPYVEIRLTPQLRNDDTNGWSLSSSSDSVTETTSSSTVSRPSLWQCTAPAVATTSLALSILSASVLEIVLSLEMLPLLQSSPASTGRSRTPGCAHDPGKSSSF